MIYRQSIMFSGNVEHCTLSRLVLFDAGRRPIKSTGAMMHRTVFRKHYDSNADFIRRFCLLIFTLRKFRQRAGTPYPVVADAILTTFPQKSESVSAAISLFYQIHAEAPNLENAVLGGASSWRSIELVEIDPPWGPASVIVSRTAIRLAPTRESTPQLVDRLHISWLLVLPPTEHQRPLERV